MVLSRSIFISFLSGLHVRLRASTDTHVYSKNCTRQTHDLHVCSPRVDVSVSHKCSVFLKPHARCCIGTRTVKHPHSRLFAMRCVTLFASSCETRRYPLAIVALSASRHRVGSQSECILLYRALGRVRSSLGRPPAKGKSLCIAFAYDTLRFRVKCEGEARSLSLSLCRVPAASRNLLSSFSWPHG